VAEYLIFVAVCGDPLSDPYVNCGGYALDKAQWLNFGITLAGLNACANEAAIFNYATTCINSWLDNNMAGHHITIPSYNSYIYAGSWRVVFRLGYQDDGDGYVDIDNSLHDYFDFHWWYETDTGQWAEKQASSDSQLISGTNADTNPYNVAWPLLYWSSFYDSSCKYYCID
jgi:hypothetical protein